MKKIILLVSLCVLNFNCKKSNAQKYSNKPMEVQTEIGEEGETVILGYMNRANLNTEEFRAWFQSEYNRLNIPDGWAEEHAPLAKNLEFKLFLGTWCGDTQRELGGMFKILDAIGVNENQIEMYAISEAKDSPIGYEKQYDILNIPTLIFFENGVEQNRIVEFPVESMIEDFSKILKKEPYKDAYADF
jgi:thiol-disulfide isomerase/thioredoxin